jgi:hypothetical protein
MKLTELFNDIVEQKINEAITISDLKNLGTNLKQGITDLGNKPMNVDFSGNLGKGQVAQSKMDALAREVGFEIPQALKTGNIKKALGPFTDLSDTSDLASFLKVSNIDMNKIRAMKSCFGRDWSDKNQLIQISNFLKVNTGGNDYVYEYEKGGKSILYYSKKGYGTYFFIEKDTPCYTSGEQLNSTDIDTIERKFKLTGLQNDAFKKVSITILN